MAYGVSNGHMTDNVMWSWKVKLVTPICWAQYLEIANDKIIVCCEAVGLYGRLLTILATAWLLVKPYMPPMTIRFAIGRFPLVGFGTEPLSPTVSEIALTYWGYNLDLSRSRDVVGHVTIRFQ